MNKFTLIKLKKLSLNPFVDFDMFEKLCKELINTLYKEEVKSYENQDYNSLTLLKTYSLKINKNILNFSSRYPDRCKNIIRLNFLFYNCNKDNKNCYEINNVTLTRKLIDKYTSYRELNKEINLNLIDNNEHKYSISNLLKFINSKLFSKLCKTLLIKDSFKRVERIAEILTKDILTKDSGFLRHNRQYLNSENDILIYILRNKRILKEYKYKLQKRQYIEYYLKHIKEFHEVNNMKEPYKMHPEDRKDFRDNKNRRLNRTKTNIATKIENMLEHGCITNWLPLYESLPPKITNVFIKEYNNKKMHNGWCWYIDIEKSNGLRFGPTFLTRYIYCKHVKVKIVKDANGRFKKCFKIIRTRP